MRERPVSDIYHTALFPYLEGDAIAGRDEDLVLIVRDVVEIEIPTQRGPEVKVLLRFEGTSKGLILNKTNAQTLWELYGRKTEGWHGKRVALYTEQVVVNRRTFNAIRIRETAPPAVTVESESVRTEAPQAEAEVAPGVTATTFWAEFHQLKSADKLPNPDTLRQAPEIGQAKASGDWEKALKWLHAQMRV